MAMSKILTDLCAIRQNVKIQTTFANTVYSDLVVKKSCKNTKKTCLKW